MVPIDEPAGGDRRRGLDRGAGLEAPDRLAGLERRGRTARPLLAAPKTRFPTTTGEASIAARGLEGPPGLAGGRVERVHHLVPAADHHGVAGQGAARRRTGTCAAGARRSRAPCRPRGRRPAPGSRRCRRRPVARRPPGSRPRSRRARSRRSSLPSLTRTHAQPAVAAGGDDGVPDHRRRAVDVALGLDLPDDRAVLRRQAVEVLVVGAEQHAAGREVRPRRRSPPSALKIQRRLPVVGVDRVEGALSRRRSRRRRRRPRVRT